MSSCKRSRLQVQWPMADQGDAIEALLQERHPRSARHGGSRFVSICLFIGLGLATVHRIVAIPYDNLQHLTIRVPAIAVASVPRSAVAVTTIGMRLLCNSVRRWYPRCPTVCLQTPSLAAAQLPAAQLPAQLEHGWSGASVQAGARVIAARGTLQSGGKERFGFGNLSSEHVIDKPESHSRRSYEHLRLNNGMHVILASDSTCDKAAAALCVGVGKLHEPKVTPGIAHFCEHMLFLGTERFPNEGEYSDFIQKNGGQTNAATSDDSTCYSFDVKPESLVGALDRFSQFFLMPLFNPSATEREINAVDSEHSMWMTDDSRRSYASLLLDANPSHPFHWGSGNAQSLRDGPRARGSDPHREVTTFYKRHYTSEDMTLAVIGRESLAELRQITEERFANITATGQRAVRGAEHGGKEPAILSANFSGIVLRVPSKDYRHIQFSWQLSQYQLPLWRTKPCAYASHILGYEGEGSLLSALKAKGWVTEFSAGVVNHASFSLFNIEAILTESGLDSVAEIGSFVFLFLRLLRDSPLQPWVFNEMQQLREMNFRFAEDEQPYEIASYLAENLQNYPPHAVLAAPEKLYEREPQASTQLLAELTVAGVRVELAAKRFENNCTNVDPWYGGQYLRRPLHEEWRNAWSKAYGDCSACSNKSTIEAAARSHGLHLPKPNPFIPEDFTVRPVESDPAPLAPTELLPVPGVARLFHRQDDRFGQPKALLTFRFYSPAAAMDAAGFLRCEFWCDAIAEELNEYSYDAGVAGLFYSLTPRFGGFELAFGGFSAKLPVLLRAVTRKMRDTSAISPSTFELVRDRFERSLTNAVFKLSPCDLASVKTGHLLSKVSFPAKERLAALRELSVSDLNDQNHRLLKERRTEALLIGNLDTQDALSLAAIVNEELPVGAAPKMLPPRAEAALPDGYTVWEINGTDVEERNNAVRLMIQIPSSLQNSVYMALLVRTLSTRFFEELRTKQQLGYIVSLNWGDGEAFLTMVCQVQSEYSPDYVRSRIDVFLQEQLHWIEGDLNDIEFKQTLEGLASNLAEAPQNLWEEYDVYWDEIARQRYDFGWLKKTLKSVEAANLASLQSFAREVIHSAPRLYVQVHSTCGEQEKQAPEDAAPAAEPDRLWRGDEDRDVFRRTARWMPLDADA